MNTAIATRDDSAQLPAAPQTETMALLDMIRRAASDPTVDVDKMQRLMAMQERVLARKAETAFNEAMSLSQGEMQRISTDATNPSTKSRYASYGKLDTALRPIYTKHGFALSYDTGDGAPEGCVRVLCYVSHRDGHTRTYRADMPSDGKGAKGGDVMTKTHATGAAFTYAQRYLLKLIFNVAIGENDTDGNESSEPISEAQKEELIGLIKETGSDTTKFLAFMKAESIDKIPAASFNAGRSLLVKKKAKQGAAK